MQFMENRIPRSSFTFSTQCQSEFVWLRG